VARSAMRRHDRRRLSLASRTDRGVPRGEPSRAVMFRSHREGQRATTARGDPHHPKRPRRDRIRTAQPAPSAIELPKPSALGAGRPRSLRRPGRHRAGGPSDTALPTGEEAEHPDAAHGRWDLIERSDARAVPVRSRAAAVVADRFGTATP
jgi:hypothetical protein